MSLAANLTLAEAEAAFLESMRSEFEARGYEFVVHPRSSELPDFFATYTPDAVARGPAGNVAIELKSRGAASSQQSLQRLRQLFDGRPDWQLRVVNMGDASGVRPLPVPSRISILERAREADQLAEDGNIRAAFMIAWSLLEAALNSARPEADKRPRTPGTVVQTLAMEGLIPEPVEQGLRPLIDLRNRVVHGDLTAEPVRADVQAVLSAVRTILG